MAYEWSCHHCTHLDKSRKEYDEKHYCYIYGCNGGERTRAVGWCLKDEDLKHMGCSFFTKPKETIQISIFD